MQILGLTRRAQVRPISLCLQSAAPTLGRELLEKISQGVIAVNRRVLYLGSILILILPSPIVFACALPSTVVSDSEHGSKEPKC
jgi:hypothetical protein